MLRRSSPGWRALMLMLFIGGCMTVAPRNVQTAPGRTQSAPRPATAPEPRAVLDKYCIACHNQKLRTAGLALDTVDVTKPSANAEVWERVIRKLRSGSMPPVGRPRPDAATYRTVVNWLETTIDRAATKNPDPGRTSTVHRLNRSEYQNAIRDLLAVEIDVSSLLPGDETSDSGFDNNADVLSIAPAQLEQYLSAARKITRLATGLPPDGPAIETDPVRVPLLLLQDDRQSEDSPLGSRGGAAFRHYFPVDGEYSIKVRLQTNYNDYIRGMGRQHDLDVRIDGALVKRFAVGGEAKGRPAPASFAANIFGDPEWEEYLVRADEKLELSLPVKAGPRVVGVSFVRSTREPVGILQPRQRGFAIAYDEMYDGNAAVDSISIGGPYNITGPGDTLSRHEIFVCHPADVSERSGAGAGGPRKQSEPSGAKGPPRVDDEEECAAKILSRLAHRAYRRPVTAGDVRTLLEFFKTGRNDGGSFDAGIQFALERLFVDPDFLLRIELDPAHVAPGHAYRLTDLEVASRLSFFLWSSIPDDQLLTLAERGKLTSPTVLEQQVRRMLADSRAKAMVDNFATQWLHLRNLADFVADSLVYPDFDVNLVQSFQRETALFIASTLREDRSVLDLLSANYTFVNERLARHYGLSGIYGERFRRVTLPDPQRRGGLLGHGGLLMLSSYPDRTSPVLRGKWLLDTIFGAPPPPPPPNVPALPERGEGGKTVSVRERLEQHRTNPVCASCHANIDPPGFTLENFDAIGAWRDVDEGGKPVDASGTMPSGERVEGLSGLRALLLDQPEQFGGTVTEKLLAYALGRRLDYYDQPTVRQIVRGAAADEYRWSSLILGIVKSPAFLMRRSQAADLKRASR